MRTPSVLGPLGVLALAVTASVLTPLAAIGAPIQRPPVRVVEGPSTGLHEPAGLAYDADGQLYVSNVSDESITVYAPRAVGDAAPVATIAGPSTGLGDPHDLFVDRSGRLYVCNNDPAAILVFAPGADGDVAPARVITGDSTRLTGPNGISVTREGRVVVADLARRLGRRPAIQVYGAHAQGDAAPIRQLKGPSTRLDSPSGIVTDHRGRIYATNWGSDTVTVFGRRADGDARPIRVVRGSRTGLDHPIDLDRDSGRNLYVVNRNRTVTVYGPRADGNRRPIATLQGDVTRLLFPSALALDDAGRFSVTEYDNDAVLTFRPLVRVPVVS